MNKFLDIFRWLLFILLLIIITPILIIINNFRTVFGKEPLVMTIKKK